MMNHRARLKKKTSGWMTHHGEPLWLDYPTLQLEGVVYGVPLKIHLANSTLLTK